VETVVVDCGEVVASRTGPKESVETGTKVKIIVTIPADEWWAYVGKPGRTT
jgi:hypothetical protein